MTATHVCRSCGAPVEHVVCDLGASPPANRYLSAEQLDAMEPNYPLVTRVCTSCWLVQLPSLVAPEDIFEQYAYFSSYSETWVRHCEAYARTVHARLGLTPAQRVVEIASNDGCLLLRFQALGVQVLGVEPARNVGEVARQRGVPTRTAFFGTATAEALRSEGVSADVICANNVLAHVPDLNDFIRGIKLLLAPNGMATIEFPHLHHLIDQTQFDTIYHEHFSYFSLLSAESALRRHALRVVDVEEQPVHGGTLRLYVRHADASEGESARLRALRQRERDNGYDGLARYARFGSDVAAAKRDLLAFLIAAKREGKTVVSYGAPAKGNTLLNYCGVRTDMLEYTVDRSEHKQGHFLPGTRIPIHHPDRILQTKPDYVLILPWNIKDEIMQQMAAVRTWGGRFVVPIPRVEVL